MSVLNRNFAAENIIKTMITIIRRIIMTMVAVLAAVGCSDESSELNARTMENTGKTLVVYYSFTNNVRTIVGELTKQLDADVLEVEPAEEGLDYAANNYAIGSSLIAGIRKNPNDAGSYPDIKPTDIDWTRYDNIVVATPLWWSQMAAPMQSFLFHNGSKMAGKHVALIVSSASSGITSTVADARRLLPDVTWAGDALWINNSNRSHTTTLLTQWLATQDFQNKQDMKKMYVTINGQTQGVTLADNQAAQQLVSKLEEGQMDVTLSSSGGFEIWGPLGFSLPTSNRQITAQPGDVVIYNGSNICLFYGSNSWSYTPLGKIDGLTVNELQAFLQAGKSNIKVTLSLTPVATSIGHVNSNATKSECYTLQGQRVEHPSQGIYISDNKKVMIK